MRIPALNMTKIKPKAITITNMKTNMIILILRHPKILFSTQKMKYLQFQLPEKMTMMKSKKKIKAKKERKSMNTKKLLKSKEKKSKTKKNLKKSNLTKTKKSKVNTRRKILLMQLKMMIVKER